MLILFLPAAYDAAQGWARYESNTAGNNAERRTYLVIAPDWFNSAYGNHGRINRLSIRLATVVSVLAGVMCFCSCLLQAFAMEAGWSPLIHKFIAWLHSHLQQIVYGDLVLAVVWQIYSRMDGLMVPPFV